MSRREELLKIVNNDIRLTELVDNIIFAEKRMEELRKYPFISVNPKNPAQQKTTAAAKEFTRLSGTYNAMIRTLASISGTDDSENEESPLRRWVKSRGDL